MKQIIIIGAGPGISLATAERFGKENFRVDLIGRNESRLEELREKLESKNIESCYVTADAGNFESLKCALDQLNQLFGTPDIVLYNAADFCSGTLDTLEWDQIAKANDTTIGGAYHTIRIMLPYFEQKKAGTFFFTGGGLALEGNPEYIALSIGKAGLRNLVQALTIKLKDSPVRCSMITVCGFINPLGRKYTPKNISEIFWSLWQSGEEFKNEIIY